MADESTTENDKAAGKGKGKKGKGDKGDKPKSNMVPAVIVAVGLLGGGFMMKGKSGGGAAEEAAAPTTAADPTDCQAYDLKNEPTEGGVVKLDPISINLEPDADGTAHYAKVGIALQLAASVNVEEFTAESVAYRALDVVNAVVVGRNMAEFGSPQAFEALKEKITDQVRPLYECEVLEVLFTEFVMQ